MEASQICTIYVFNANNLGNTLSQHGKTGMDSHNERRGLFVVERFPPLYSSGQFCHVAIRCANISTEFIYN